MRLAALLVLMLLLLLQFEDYNEDNTVMLDDLR
jgi:hypothetical protein